MKTILVALALVATACTHTADPVLCPDGSMAYVDDNAFAHGKQAFVAHATICGDQLVVGGRGCGTLTLVASDRLLQTNPVGVRVRLIQSDSCAAIDFDTAFSLTGLRSAANGGHLLNVCVEGLPPVRYGF